MPSNTTAGFRAICLCGSTGDVYTCLRLSGFLIPTLRWRDTLSESSQVLAIFSTSGTGPLLTLTKRIIFKNDNSANKVLHKVEILRGFRFWNHNLPKLNTSPSNHDLWPKVHVSRGTRHSIYSRRPPRRVISKIIFAVDTCYVDIGFWKKEARERVMQSS